MNNSCQHGKTLAKSCMWLIRQTTEGAARSSFFTKEEGCSVNGIVVNATGVISITQERMNKLLADSISSDTTVFCQCEDENCLRLTIVTKTQGVIQLKLRVIEVKHDPYNTAIKVQLLERRLAGNPIKAMLFASMPDNVINFLLKMFALPPTIKVANVGDFYSVDFRDWIQQSPLAEKRLMGVRLLDCIRIGWELKL